jgi:hypothetical protein
MNKYDFNVVVLQYSSFTFKEKVIGYFKKRIEWRNENQEQ